MWARVTTIQTDRDEVEAAIDNVKSVILPRASELEGFRGLWLLVDRASGKGQAITLWESEDAMQASEDVANQMREENVSATDSQLLSVDRYEVVMHEQR